MRIILSLILFLSSFQACAMGRRVAIDPVVTSTVLSGDDTSIVEGCGNQPFVGGTFCRQVEGDATDKSIWLIGPPAKCSKDQCVFFKIFDQQGNLVFGGALDKGKTRIEVPWKSLLSRDTFQMADRGLWGVRTTVFWIDKDGFDHQSDSTGTIILRVYAASYLPLNEVSTDPNYVWEWVDNGQEYKMTSSLRAYTKKAPVCGLN